MNSSDIALAVFNFVTLTRDATTLRDELMSTLNEPAHTRIQLTVGPAFLTTLRTGLSVIDRIPAEARLAPVSPEDLLSAVKRLSQCEFGADLLLMPHGMQL